MDMSSNEHDNYEQNSPNDRYGGNTERSPERSRSRSPIRRSGSRSPRRDSRDRPRRINLISKRCIISNVPYEMKWQDIKDIFRKEVGEVSYVEMWENPDGKSRGAGIIEFKDKDTARKAIEVMHRYKMKDRNIVVREERESDQNQIGAARGGGGGGGGGGSGMMGSGPGMMGSMGGGMMGNMSGGGNMGVSQQVLNNLGIEGPVTNTLFVSNLDYKVTWKKMKDVFKLAGNVLRAEIKLDKDGKSRGIGTVVFEFPMEALQAISMFNNQTLFDRPMRVKMDTPPGGATGGRSSQAQLPSGLKSVGMGLGAGGQPLQNIGQINSGGGYGMGSGGSMGMGGNNMGMGGGNMGMGGGGGMGMGGGMDNSMVGMGGNMGTGMSGMGGMGSNMGMSGNMGTGMSSNMGMGMGTGMAGTGNLGSNMGMSGGMNDSFSSSMVSGGMGNTGYGTNTGMGTGLGDQLRSMGSNMGSSSYNTGMMDSMGSSSGNMGSSSYNSMGSSFSSSDRSSQRDRDRSGDRGDRGGRNLGTRPDNCTVVVKNLPWSLTWQSLRDKFRTCADVKYAEIKMENGKSQGWGLVRFGSAEDAQRAISAMNRTRVDGREIDVKLYR
ncbi:myelin expression factor 2-like isoform X1 [Pecten maximus]|uniref:myelin expression factor 2-like isoform X1 n=1 Tax=Pecten maximus TaxID=6579 RepID=UPI001458E658|nr:myelin expression factor 2-like isoform X1 [Pecten maximus]